ncbi:hypothetical protein J1N35_014407 [Gossypium stocksii]|uniref:Uncharacterized protein n=1 Tax=Gossypium stocksii TaxID=47602 RepID=A0A9D3VWG9_9ROSI|nr:hypothetical protein J1N35_014407 [Gossypium stocksii]
MQNCVVRHSGPAYFPFTTTILCLKAKILTNIKKTGKDLEEEKEDPIEIELVQEAEVLGEVEPMEPEAEPDVETSMFRTQSPCLDLRDKLSKFMYIMQHMQWQQQAYWRY